jgi:hypothetical protein
MSYGHHVSLAALVTLFALFVLSCGGSASETPPPLEPDLSRAATGAPATGRYVVVTPRADAGQKTAPTDDEEAEGDAIQTWGD